MVMIPQIVRDRLIGSSVVGTPGTDPSRAAIGEAIGKTEGNIAQTGFGVLEEGQNLRNEAEKSTLQAESEMATFKTLETAKAQYANDPQKVVDMVMPTIEANTTSAEAKASNPIVKLGVGILDPFSKRYFMGATQSWAFQQQARVDKARLVDGPGGLNDTFNTAEQIGSSDKPYIEKMQDLTVLHDIGGKLISGAYSAAHPDSAAELEGRFSPTVITRAAYGMLTKNPAQAAQFLKEDWVQKSFESNPKELDELQQMADKRAAGQVKAIAQQEMIRPLLDNEKVIQQIGTHKVDWNMLTAMPSSPLKTQLMNMSLDAYPVENGAQRDQARAEFYAEAASLGANSKKMDYMSTASSLVKFNTDLAAAFNNGLITQSDYKTYMGKLALPLRDAMLKLHDPNTYAHIQKDPGLMGLIGQTHQEPDHIIDKYGVGYNVINRWLEHTGQGQDWTLKANSVSKFMQMWDAAKPEDRDQQGRPYDAEAMARKAIGIGDGDTVDTPFGPKTITGYDRASGTPKYELSKEEYQRFTAARIAKKAAQ